MRHPRCAPSLTSLLTCTMQRPNCHEIYRMNTGRFQLDWTGLQLSVPTDGSRRGLRFCDRPVLTAPNFGKGR